MATAGKTTVSDNVRDAILSRICEDDIVAMCCEVINIPSPTGSELAMAEYMRSVFQHLGLTITWQQVEDTRANVIGRLEGRGNGKCLMFNGHMDTSNTGDEDFLTGIGYKPHAVVKDGMIYGLGIYNMKGALVCYVHAVKALLEAGRQAGGRRHPGRGLRRDREDAVGRISRQGVSRLRRWYALSCQPWRSA